MKMPAPLASCIRRSLFVAPTAIFRSEMPLKLLGRSACVCVVSAEHIRQQRMQTRRVWVPHGQAVLTRWLTCISDTCPASTRRPLSVSGPHVLVVTLVLIVGPGDLLEPLLRRGHGEPAGAVGDAFDSLAHARAHPGGVTADEEVAPVT